jgi:diguanylate cyclase (GGDEF)-like protein
VADKLAIEDDLTGLYSRDFFEDRIRYEFRRAQRYSDPVSLILIDIDGLERLNQAHGRGFGDEVLAESARITRRVLRDADICARFDGDAFAAILPKTHLTGALTVAQRVWRALGQHAFGRNVRVTTSVGIAFFPAKDVVAAQHLVAQAEEALARAKAQGRNLICLYQAQVYRYDVEG